MPRNCALCGVHLSIKLRTDDRLFSRPRRSLTLFVLLEVLAAVIGLDLSLLDDVISVLVFSKPPLRILKILVFLPYVFSLSPLFKQW